MDDLAQLAADHEPSVETTELLCDRLADLGLAIDAATARDLIRTILAAEAPKLDVRWRGALRASLDTIRIAAQAAVGMLNTTAGPKPAPRPAPAAPQAAEPAAQAPTVQIPTAPARTPTRTPAARTPAAPAPAPSPRSPTPLPGSQRPIARRGPRRPSREEPAPPAPGPERRGNAPDSGDLGEPGERRPVFKRPRGR